MHLSSTAFFCCIVCFVSCSSTTAGNDGGRSDASTPWSGDPCSLLTDTDFAMLSTPTRIMSTRQGKVGTTLTPECRFFLGNPDSTGIATMTVFVDPVSEFALQKSVYKGTVVAGIGKDAWQGDAGGQGSSTVGVLLDTWSFRVDSTYEYKYPDLIILAKAMAGRVK